MILSLTLFVGARPGVADDAPVPASQLGDSVFRDAWHAVLQEAKIEIAPVAAPRDVRRDMFVRGDILLDCCSVPEWRNRADEQAVQLFSDPFFLVVDHLILHEGRDYGHLDPADLSGWTVGAVQGFSFRDQQHFGGLVTAVSMGEVFDLVVAGKADLTIASNQEFYRRQRLAPRPLVLGPEYDRVVLRIRVHNSRPDLLVRINAAIAALKADGRINRLTGQRLRPEKD
ncbi:MAG: transporter substrate-binding domain-containing protein [Alphaproteobacteria bacterium]|nr:MAG: transporter substrate-binding domain-containing protein [Alphaproteobacteria bacterium]